MTWNHDLEIKVGDEVGLIKLFHMKCENGVKYVKTTSRQANLPLYRGEENLKKEELITFHSMIGEADRSLQMLEMQWIEAKSWMTIRQNGQAEIYDGEECQEKWEDAVIKDGVGAFYWKDKHLAIHGVCSCNARGQLKIYVQSSTFHSLQCRVHLHSISEGGTDTILVKEWPTCHEEGIELLECQVMRFISQSEQGLIFATAGKDHLTVWRCHLKYIEKTFVVHCSCLWRAKTSLLQPSQLSRHIHIYDMDFTTHFSKQPDQLPSHHPHLSFEIAVASGDGHVYLFSPSQQKKPVKSIKLSPTSLKHIRFIPSQRQLIVANTTNALYHVNIDGPHLLGQFKGLLGACVSMAILPSTQDIQSSLLPQKYHLATVSLDRYLRIYSIPERTLLSKIYLHQRPLKIIMEGQQSAPVIESPHIVDDDIWNHIPTVVDESMS